MVFSGILAGNVSMCALMLRSPHLWLTPLVRNPRFLHASLSMSSDAGVVKCDLGIVTCDL